MERVLAQVTDVTIASLHADDRPDIGVVTVGGLVTSVQRKTTKQGSLWAIVTLEDLEGSVDVMVFPQSYQAASSLLIDVAVIVVRARADRSYDDGLRLIAMEVTAPDLSEAVSGPVRITMATSRLVPPLSDRLKEVLSGHPGTTEVHLHLDDGNRVAVMRLGDRFRVTPSPALYGDLKALLGAACLS